MKKFITTASVLVVALSASVVQAQRAPVRTGGTRVLERPTETRGRTTVEVARPTTAAPTAKQADVRAESAPKSVVSGRSAVAPQAPAASGAQCRLDVLGGVNIKTALTAGTAGVTSCGADLSPAAQKVAATALNAADAVRVAFGLRSAASGTVGQRAEIAQAFAKSLDRQSDALTYDQALANTAEICGKCGILGASVCDANVLKAAGARN